MALLAAAPFAAFAAPLWGAVPAASTVVVESAPRPAPVPSSSAPGATAVVQPVAGGPAAEALAPAEVSATVAPPPTDAPPPPEYAIAIGGDSYVIVSWEPSMGKGILGYNIYRTTEVGLYGTVPVNKSLVTGTEFTDNEVNSTFPPVNDETYYYTIRAVDTVGVLSQPSEEVSARPQGAKVISEIPNRELSRVRKKFG